jgi:hypothetical protein
LLAAAARFSGAGHPVHFGPKRQKQFTSSRESELALLGQDLVAALPPELKPNFTGGEHQVWIDDPPTTVLKHTLPGFYGRTVDESVLLDARTFQNRHRLILRGALPSEYLRRWAVLHSVFGLPTVYHGKVGSGPEPQMAIAQPYIEQDDSDPPTLYDVTLFMEAYGFAKIEPQIIAIPEVADVTWYRQADGILITDAHARNFRKDLDGVIIPVDLVVTLIPKGASQVLPEPMNGWRFDEKSSS